MEDKVWGCCSSEEDSDDNINNNNEFNFQKASDDEENDHNLHLRNVQCKGWWNDEIEMTEVADKNGKMCVTSGVCGSDKTYSSIEETVYLMELGDLHLSDNGGDRSLALMDMYKKVIGRKGGCCWEQFEVYRHLKNLGYIVGRHGVDIKESKQLVDTGYEVELPFNELFGELQIDDLRPDFDVYPPNSRFQKSSPGDPSFLLYLAREHPPSRTGIEIEALEKQCDGIPLKIGRVTGGRVSFFSFDNVELPVLP
ncbi:PREDICTED: uncharacterized protein LOC109356046 isoform X2 [Lupinus angustifolius]|uniref:uncharacterized protein LOC109356046 isoform X2 n=1 Tax=Lupinus angustifolius TaxID=3871 RepID=UPI00092F6A35|nr:PREDICTED: uncharacterized protein LOC109356046 isoform X2 [Lupinus angustifolius]